jgi:hypothetical protein
MDVVLSDSRVSLRSSWIPLVLSTMVGCAIGLGLSAAVYLVLGFTNETYATAPGAALMGLGFGAAFGAGTGIPQARLLRGHIDRPGSWVVASTVSYAVGLAVTLAMLERIDLIAGFFTGYPLTGLVAGFLQWKLGICGGKAGGGRWAITSGIAYFVAFFSAVASEPVVASALGLSDPSFLGQSAGGVGYAIVQGALVGLLFGLITSTVLVLLLRRGPTISRPLEEAVRPTS